MLRDVAAGARVELRLPSTGRIRGVVVDERGQPVREYWLRAFTNDTFTEHAESVMSPDGTFDLQGISPETVSLAAMFATVHGETPVTLAPGQELDGVRIVLSRGQMHAN